MVTHLTQVSFSENTKRGFNFGGEDQINSSGGSARRWNREAQKRNPSRVGSKAGASTSSSDLPRDFLKAEKAGQHMPSFASEIYLVELLKTRKRGYGERPSDFVQG